MVNIISMVIMVSIECLIIEFSVHITAEESGSHFRQQLLTNQFQTTLQSVCHFGFALICNQFHSTTTVHNRIQRSKVMSSLSLWLAYLSDAMKLSLSNFKSTSRPVASLYSWADKLNTFCTRRMSCWRQRMITCFSKSWNKPFGYQTYHWIQHSIRSAKQC